MEIEQTKSLDDAIHHLQSLPPTLREEVFHYIDFLRIRSANKEQTQNSTKKRQFFICKGKGSFVIKDDFDMTEEELVETKTVKRHAGTLKGEVIFSDDFDESLDEFKDYMKLSGRKCVLRSYSESRINRCVESTLLMDRYA